MPDSLESIGSDDSQEQPALVDPTAEDSSNDADDTSAPEPDVNPDALRATLEAVRTQSDLESLKRQAGHVPGLQREVADLKRSVSEITSLKESNQHLAGQVNTLLDMFAEAGVLTDRQVQGLRPQRGDSNADLLAAIDGALEKRLPTASTQANEPTPEQLAYMRQADAATAQVEKYAKDKGYDGESIPAAVYTRALEASRGDFTAAALDVMRYVDGELAKKNRRAERADAASGGTGERSARSGALTMSKLKSMTRDEVREFDAANPGVIDKVMAGK